MPKFEIEYTEEELKAVNYFTGDGKEWLQTSWNKKAELRINACIKEKTDYNPEKITKAKKINLIKTIDLPAKNLNKTPTPPAE